MDNEQLSELETVKLHVRIWMQVGTRLSASVTRKLCAGQGWKLESWFGRHRMAGGLGGPARRSGLAVLCALDLQMFVTQCLSNADCFFQEENHK